MMHARKFMAGLALLAAAGCDMAGDTMADAEEVSPAERACLRDVAAETNNPQVVVLDSLFSQAGTEVTVGVGPQQAPWGCIAYSDGTTAAIRSLVDEGTL